MQKFVNGRNGLTTQEYYWTHAELTKKLHHISEMRGQFKRLKEVRQSIIGYHAFNGWNEPTIGIHDVDNLPAEMKRQVLKRVLLDEQLDYPIFGRLVECASGEEIEELLFIYMGRRFYWRGGKRSYRATSLEQWCQSWVGRYSSGQGNGGQYSMPSGIVIGYHYTSKQNYTATFIVRQNDGTIGEQTKEMLRTERNYIRSLNQ